ncbi:MAG: hypothetical protein JAY75_17900 [Candidatus Thiodiazotropha taylori]|nr:hypothetical protein [Candidatus Thiodiazotropha taylori]MCG8078097.1 hypothetical protein [Candidatus Thiodiazotropha taylori]MCW4310091.1 hypothetical protein [Candidatus Thiodiazotropha endolucinida]MCW4336683.1 hypothetical protein [Candidatus Thiodiazotropha endolucinida]
MNSTSVMEDVCISVNGILKLLQALKPRKAAGLDRLNPLVLKELRDEIAPIMKIIFERPIATGKLPVDWCKTQVTPVPKKEISRSLQITGPFH